MTCFLTPLLVAVFLSVGSFFSKKFGERTRFLRLLMWGCAVGLSADHVINGELVFHPPFLTGWNPAAGIMPLLEEIVFVGGTITLSVTAFWGIMAVAPKIMSAPVFQKILSMMRGTQT